MKEQRNLSGIYFRSKNEDTGRFENRVFEDLSEQQQDEILGTKEPEYLKRMVKLLANTINEIGNQFDLMKD